MAVTLEMIYKEVKELKREVQELKEEEDLTELAERLEKKGLLMSEDDSSKELKKDEV